MGVSLRTWSLGMLTLQFSAFILLLHYSRVMPPPDGHRYLPSTAVFLVELIKLAVCLTVALYEVSQCVPKSMPATALFSALSNTIFMGDSWKMAIPASLYTLSNSLQYVGISNLDAATFQVTYQLKIFVTALFSVFLLRKHITSRQWVSLVLLMAGVAIVSLPKDADIGLPSSHHARIYIPRSSNVLRDYLSGTARHIAKRSATYEGIMEDERLLDNPEMDARSGFAAVLGVCIFSGLAGVYFEKVIKDSPSFTSIWVRNVQMSVYSLFPAFFIGVVFIDGETVAKHGFFAGYNWVVVLAIVVQSFGGIVAAFCIFYADNISKNFAVSISTVVSGFASFFLFDFVASFQFLFGTFVVLAATYLYGIAGGRSSLSPVITIDHSEKQGIESSAEANDVSIKILKTSLSGEENVRVTSRPGSPVQKKRKADTVNHLTKSHD